MAVVLSTPLTKKINDIFNQLQLTDSRQIFKSTCYIAAAKDSLARFASERFIRFFAWFAGFAELHRKVQESRKTPTFRSAERL